MENVAGQIKINVPEKGPIEIIIKGQVRAGVITRLPHDIRRAWRVHLSKLNRDRQPANISPGSDELENKIEEPAPLKPDPINLPPDLSAPPMVDEFLPDSTSEDTFEVEDITEQANNPDESEEEDAIDEGTDTVHRDDEESGSEGGPDWKK